MLEREIISHVELGLPTTEQGETGSQIQEESVLVGSNGRGGDVSDLITIVDVVGIQRQNVGEGTNKGALAGTAVIETGKFALKLSSIVFKLIPFLNVSVTPVRNLDDFGQALHGDEGLVKEKGT